MLTRQFNGHEAYPGGTIGQNVNNSGSAVQAMRVETGISITTHKHRAQAQNRHAANPLKSKIISDTSPPSPQNALEGKH